MLYVILCVVLADLCVNAVTLAFICADRRTYRTRVKERKLDEIVERTITEQAKRDIMDEGFENIMSYSVGGANGFGGRDDE